MTAPCPSLTFVHEVAYDVALDDLTPVEALAQLVAHGCTADREALAEAVAAIQLRDRFLSQQGDPYEYCGVDGPRVGQGNIWDAAVAKAETELSWALQVLARWPALSSAS